MIALSFHHVGIPLSEVRYKKLYVSANNLSQWVRLLKALGYSFTTVSDWFLKKDRSKIACLTFDDGFLDNLKNGFPVLQAEGVPATVFCVTGDIGKKEHRWDESGETSKSHFLTQDDLKFLHDQGWEIGSHSSAHIHHSRRTPEEQRIIVQKSFNDLEAILKIPPKTFAYPYGDLNDDTVQAVKEAGFLFACTTRPGVNADQTDMLQLNRVAMGGTNMRHLVQGYAKILRWTWRDL